MSTITLYHYTNGAGSNGIESSGRITVSTDTVIDANFGIGVYLTDMNSDVMDIADVARKLYLGGYKKRLDKGYLDYVIVIQVDARYVHRVDPARGIYLYPGKDLILDDGNVVKGYNVRKVRK